MSAVRVVNPAAWSSGLRIYRYAGQSVPWALDPGLKTQAKV
ncbi:hypothetical protein [Lactobacillus equicursoris]|nr:hypothetical protein [Lactobacillus equicursoris]